MTVPLILLAIPSVLMGVALGFPIGAGLIDQWLEPVFAGANEVLGHERARAVPAPGASTACLIRRQRGGGGARRAGSAGTCSASSPLLGLQAKPRPEAVQR